MLFLTIEYQSLRYMGAMQFDDTEFCYEIFNILKSHVGYSIKQIGGSRSSLTYRDTAQGKGSEIASA
jgi:hypothetical protein